MNVLTITGRKGGNQGRAAKLLAEVFSGLGCLVLVDDAGKTTPYHPYPNTRAAVPTGRVFMVRTRDR